MIITQKIDDKTTAKIIKDFRNFETKSNSEYVIFFAQYDDVTITIYKNKKNQRTITITGNNNKFIDKISQYYLTKENTKIVANIKNSKNTLMNKNLGFVNIDDQIGSDEVGTGDFFGPVIVCAALVRKKDVNDLVKLGVTDSKKMTDEKILLLGPQLIKKYKYSIIILSHKKYNDATAKGYNEVKIKTLLHNKVLFNLQSENKDIKNLFVDKFVSENKYYDYLKNEKNIAKKITFETKGETHFPSVALASVIARYNFLIYMKKLDQKYGMHIPFGAAKIVDSFADKFIKLYSVQELDKICKKHFANYKRVTEKFLSK